MTPQDRIVFQFAPQGSSSWTTETPAETLNPLGFVDLTVPEDAYAVPGTWRAVWVGPGGAIRVSRDVSYPG